MSERIKWNRTPSPRDGQRYHVHFKNCIDDEWAGEATADPNARNGWSNGKWQDWAKEVKAWRTISQQDPRDGASSVGDCDIREGQPALSRQSH